MSTDEERANALVKILSGLSSPMKSSWLLLVDNLTTACESRLLHQLWSLPLGSVIATSKQSLAPALEEDCDRLVLSRLDEEPATTFVISAYKGKAALSSSGTSKLRAFVNDGLQCIPLKCHLAREVLSLILRKSQSSSADEAVRQLVSTCQTSSFIIRSGAQHYTQDGLLASLVERVVKEALPDLCCTRAGSSSDAADAERLATNAIDLLLLICYTTPEQGLSVAMFSESGLEKIHSQQPQELATSIQLLEDVGLVRGEERDSAAWGRSIWLKLNESMQLIVLKQLREHSSFVSVLNVAERTANYLWNRGPLTWAEAEHMMRRSLSIVETLHSDVKGVHADVARVLSNIAGLLKSRGPLHYSESEIMYRRSLSIVETLHSHVKGVHADVARVLSNIAGLLKCRGPLHYPEAEIMYRQSLSILEKLHSDNKGMHTDVAEGLNNLALLLESRGPLYYSEAEKMFRRSLRILQTLHGDDKSVHKDVARLMSNFAGFLTRKGLAMFKLF